jgi:hypothetical protein
LLQRRHVGGVGLGLCQGECDGRGEIGCRPGLQLPQQLGRLPVVAVQEPRHGRQRAGQHAQVGDQAIENGARVRVVDAWRDHTFEDPAGAEQLLLNGWPHATFSMS